MIIANHELNASVFDGVYPYSGITNAIARRKNILKVWVKRGMLKEYVGERVRAGEKYFNLVIIPGELGHSNVFQDSEKCITVPSIVFLERSELLPRDEVVSALGLDSRKKTALIQLGAGNINDIETQAEIVIDTVSRFDNIQVVLASSVIAQRSLKGVRSVKIITDYPLSRYYLGFDFAITAAGYNTVAELTYFGVPSIFIPNLQTGADDQVRRATLAAASGTSLVVHPFSVTRLEECLAVMLDDKKNAEYRKCCLSCLTVNGAESVVAILTQALFGPK